ncbi:MAG: class I SAM-dependent methyltransferase [Desulfobacteraceae bacterium]|nr:class I SAM-dependent methyltransferase [Desulfobacteraceae bacterium]
MNNPIRGYLQEIHEVRILREMTSIKSIERALEIGCGNGNGTRLIKKYFNPQKITAVDLDERMIEIARRKDNDPSIDYQVMDASKLDFPDHSFDAVFDFGIIHHIPNWKDCISELKRVLKPEGTVILEELSTETFLTIPGRIWKVLLDHPYDEMFSKEEFVDELESQGFMIRGYKESYPLKLFTHFSLVATKQSVS